MFSADDNSNKNHSKKGTISLCSRYFKYCAERRVLSCLRLLVCLGIDVTLKGLQQNTEQSGSTTWSNGKASTANDRFSSSLPRVHGLYQFRVVVGSCSLSYVWCNGVPVDTQESMKKSYTFAKVLCALQWVLSSYIVFVCAVGLELAHLYLGT